MSFVFPTQFAQAFVAFIKMPIVDWYVERGLKVEQEVQRNVFLWGFLVCVFTSLCLASYFGGPSASHEAAICLRILRGVAFPYMMLRLLFQQTKVANDPNLLHEMREAIKTAFKYGGENPGRAGMIGGILAATGIFNYVERQRK